jgi:hypothetical protein
MYLSALRCRQAIAILLEAVVLRVQEIGESVLNPYESFRLVFAKLVDARGLVGFCGRLPASRSGPGAALPPSTGS